MSIVLEQVDAKIGASVRFLDIFLVLDRIVTKIRTDAIIAEHGSISSYLTSLFDKYQVNDLSIKVYAPNGTATKLIDTITVTSGVSSSIQGTADPVETTAHEKQPDPPKQQITLPMENNQNSFYALQNELIRNAYETLKKDYDTLQQKFNKSDDELRIAKTNLAIADGMKDMAVLKGTVEASSSLGGIMKDAFKPENADGLAKLVHAFKGTVGEGSTPPAIFKDLNQVQKDSLQAISDVLKTISAEETEAMVGVVIMAAKDPTGNFFQSVKTGMEANLLTNRNT
jgi:hypothetical protein